MRSCKAGAAAALCALNSFSDRIEVRQSTGVRRDQNRSPSLAIHPRFMKLCAKMLFSSHLLAIAAATIDTSADAIAAVPALHIENVRRAFHNGEHNAFTDLVRWRDRFWLAFRSSPDGHGVFASGSVIILSSTDAKTWRQVHRFSVSERDTRDPHFLVFRDKLFVYTGTAHVGPEGKRHTDWNAHYGYATWTENGTSWAKPHALEGTYGHYIWRAAAHGGKAYLCARRWREHQPGRDRSTMEAALLESEDGLRWRFAGLIQETEGNETALWFEPDGTLIGLSRANDQFSVLARSRAPFIEWTRETLPGYIAGPMLARWGERWVVGGGRKTSQGSRTTTLLWLQGTQLVPFAELPSAGDNSYPGFVQLDDSRALVSWYSSHEKNADGKPITAIYLADLTLAR